MGGWAGSDFRIPAPYFFPPLIFSAPYFSERPVVLKGNYKDNCSGLHKNTIFLYRCNVFLGLRAFHCWSREASENDKLRKDSPQRQVQREMPRFP